MRKLLLEVARKAKNYFRNYFRKWKSPWYFSSDANTERKMKQQASSWRRTSHGSDKGKKKLVTLSIVRLYTRHEFNKEVSSVLHKSGCGRVQENAGNCGNLWTAVLWATSGSCFWGKSVKTHFCTHQQNKRRVRAERCQKGGQHQHLQRPHLQWLKVKVRRLLFKVSLLFLWFLQALDVQDGPPPRVVQIGRSVQSSSYHCR